MLVLAALKFTMFLTLCEAFTSAVIVSHGVMFDVRLSFA